MVLNHHVYFSSLVHTIEYLLKKKIILFGDFFNFNLEQKLGLSLSMHIESRLRTPLAWLQT